MGTRDKYGISDREREMQEVMVPTRGESVEEVAPSIPDGSDAVETPEPAAELEQSAAPLELAASDAAPSPDSIPETPKPAPLTELEIATLIDLMESNRPDGVVHEGIEPTADNVVEPAVPETPAVAPEILAAQMPAGPRDRERRHERRPERPHEMRAKMKEADQKEPPPLSTEEKAELASWNKFRQLAEQVKEATGIVLILGNFEDDQGQMSVRHNFQENINGARRILNLAEYLPDDHFKNVRLVPGNGFTARQEGDGLRVTFDVRAPGNNLYAQLIQTVPGIPADHPLVSKWLEEQYFPNFGKDIDAPPGEPVENAEVDQDAGPKALAAAGVAGALKAGDRNPTSVEKPATEVVDAEFADEPEAPRATGEGPLEGEVLDADTSAQNRPGQPRLVGKTRLPRRERPVPPSPELAIAVPATVEFRPIAELKQELDEARAEYVKAKSAAREKKGDSYAANLLAAENRYRSAHVSYVESDVNLHMAESDELYQAQVAEYAAPKEGKVTRTVEWFKMAAEKARNAYQALGEYSLYNNLKEGGYNFQDSNRVMRTATKMVNARSAINLVLLGTGMGTAQYGMHGVSLMAMGVRSGISAFASGFGSRDLMENLRMSLEKTYSKEKAAEMGLPPVEELAMVEDRMSLLQARGLFRGSRQVDARTNPEYLELSERRRELLQGMTPDERLTFLAQNALELDRARELSLRDEKRERRGTAAFGAVVGSVVGANAIRNAVEGWQAASDAPTKIELKDPPKIDYPEFRPNASEAAPQPDAELAAGPNAGEAVGASEGATMEQLKAKLDNAYGPSTNAPEGVDLAVGSRGVEGTLLDLQKTDSARYGSMMKWLHGKYPDFQGGDSSLVHKAVVDVARDNGLTVDGGGLDLSKIESGKIHFNADGSFSMGKDSFDFMPSGGSPDLNSAQDAHGATESIAKLDGTTFHSVAEAAEAPEAVSVPEALPNNGNLSEAFAENAERVVPGLDEKKLEFAVQEVEKKQMGFALRHVMGREYKPFVEKFLYASGWDLSRVQKMTVREFMDMAASDQTPPNLARKYKGMLNASIEYLDKQPGAQKVDINSESMRKFLIRMGMDYMRKGVR